ncbi:unnamed protein product [Fraxinus pennsylvanica]|uniref:DUF4378 domain-containing protein n=1 Tax=Fraxinus pennsylvanica TaxID=56036 RepID=A0AAD1ZFP5_9LAMI|nr:unnamed protein product [Fraxinus pennsylvanica]
MSGMMQEQNLEKQIGKQMGCMAGFLHLFDCHHILTGKRLYSTTKRLPPSTAVDSSPKQEKSAGSSPALSRESKNPVVPVAEVRSPAAATELPPKSPLTLPVFELKEGSKSSWKFCKETARLSLDSRATTDAKGSLHPREIRTNASILSPVNTDNGAAGGHQHRSRSVIARLMGLEPLSNSSNPEPEKKVELRRSNSESRVQIDGKFFHFKPPNQAHSIVQDNAVFETPRHADPIRYSFKSKKTEQPKDLIREVNLSPWKTPTPRKGFFDSTDIFPEPKRTISIEGEIEKRLRMRGIDETSKDLETLKQILEALQLKGLLHSKKLSEQNQLSYRNFVYNESPLTKPSRSTPVYHINRRMGNNTSPLSYRNQARRNLNLAGREHNVGSPTRTTRNSSSPTRSESNGGVRRSNSPVKPRPLSVETHRRVKESPENRRVSPIQSPKLTTRRTGPDPTVTIQSPRNKKPITEIHQTEKITTIVVTEDESSSISESTVSTSLPTDKEMSKMEDYKEGKSLLERCDKLLNSIAEITTTDLQPSPVSVLDSSFYRDEPSPSPIATKRSINFKDQQGESEEDIWSPDISPIQSKCKVISEESDLFYISDILRASQFLPEDSDIFLLLEKQQYLNGKDTSKVSRLQRKLVFDTIGEILGRDRQLPPWKAVSWTNISIEQPSLEKIWSEFQTIREHECTGDLLDIICGVLKKDLARDTINGWEDCPVEMSEAVLDIERLVFKDLIGETIQDLATLVEGQTVSFSEDSIQFLLLKSKSPELCSINIFG